MGIRTATSAQVSGFNGGGDFQFGDCVPATLNAPTITNVLCNGGTSGAITLNASGGSAPFTYSWTSSPAGFTSTSQNISGLSARDYTVVVTAQGGCTATATYTVTQPPILAASITSQANILCFGSSTGSVTITGSGGTGSITYSKDGTSFQASGTFSGLAANSYTITLKDDNGCTATVPVTITQTCLGG